MTSNSDFNVTILFNAKQLENGIRQSYSYNSRPIEILKLYVGYQTAPFSMTLNDPEPRFKVTPYFDAKYLQMAKDTATTECE